MADSALYDSDDDDAPILVNMKDTSEGFSKLEEKEDAPLAPVTILSGFLGAGKTTLVRYILQSPDHGKRIAVIENEFGGGDGLSVESLIARDGVNQENLTDLIELPNGCICCTVKDSLVSTLENLIDKRKNLDYILIEASGMANPGPIASLFWLDEALESRLRLDGVVTVVDAYNVQRQLQDTEEAALQIAYADRILLNKVDLINDDQKQAAVDSIRAIHPTVPIRPTTHSQVPDLDWILDANCYDVDRAKEVDRILSQVKEEEFHSCRGPYCTPCADENPSHAHSHTSAVGTVALAQEGSVELSRMNRWLASILWPNQDGQDKVLRARAESESAAVSLPSFEMQIFRIKGILSVWHTNPSADDEPYLDQDGLDSRRYIVQAVHDLWEIHPASDDLQWDRPVDGQDAFVVRTCKLVFIGRFLEVDSLRTGFKSCFIDSNE